MTFRVRAMDANGDMTFGRSAANFLVDSPSAVGQVVATRLLLFEGEIFYNTTIGTPYLQTILGKSHQNARDAAVRQQIVETPFVSGLRNYSTLVNSTTRAFSAIGQLLTAFGGVNITVAAGAGGGTFTLGQSTLGGGDPLG